MTETFKDIPGYEGLYQVSDQGRVKSLKRTVPKNNGRTQTMPERILTPSRSRTSRRKDDYLTVGLSKDGKAVKRYVHRLVYESFREDALGLDVCHEDGDTMNNHLSNLRADTRHGNMQDCIRHGNSNRGEKNGSSKLSRDDVRKIRSMKNTSNKELSDLFQVTRSCIEAILSGKRWGWLDA